ncbi:MAG: S-adenosylmethionine decarboxylase [Candidatus Bilamarchaeaceae archaeon]
MGLTHLHLAVNAKIDPSFSQLPKDRAQEFVDRLMVVTDMKPLGPLNWSDAVDLDFPGQSFVQMITTSHSSLHFFADTNEIYFDLYSCKEYDPQKVIGLLDEFFGLREWHGILYNRAHNSIPLIQQLGNQPMAMSARRRIRKKA